MVCLEDGIMACGFRKFSGSVERLIPDARFCFVSTNNLRSLSSALIGDTGGGGELGADRVDEIARHAFESMDKNGDSKIDFDEFCRWWRQSGNR